MHAKEAKELATRKLADMDHMDKIVRAIKGAAEGGYFKVEWVSHSFKANPTERHPNEAEIGLLIEMGYQVNVSSSAIPIVTVSWS